MEKIANIMGRTESLTQHHTYLTASEMTRAKKIIVYLKTVYPAKTANIYGTTEQIEIAVNLWARNLVGIEDEYIGQAMEACVDRFVWAPDIAEFKQLAMSFKGSSRIPWSEDVLKFCKPKKTNETNMRVKTLIDEGADVCRKLKKIYPDRSWMDISSLFTDLKNKARVFYPGFDDLSIIRELMKYKDEDILDLLAIGSNG